MLRIMPDDPEQLADLIEKLDSMKEKIESFPNKMGEEFWAWQTDDMGRKVWTNMRELDRYTRETTIPARGPRRRLDPATQKAQAQDRRQRNRYVLPSAGGGGVGRFGRAKRGTVRGWRAIKQPAYRAKPIVREELMDMLKDRMRELLVKEIGWDNAD